MRLKKVMGYDRHRIVGEGVTVSDLSLFGLRHMIDNGWISRDDIGAIVVVTLCPDYFVPHISTILQGELGFDHDVLCIDISQGCCGFLMGLMESFMVLDHIGGKKVVLINGDVLSRKVSMRDRNDYPLIGDAATITIIENSLKTGDIYYEMHMDGSRGEVLMIPAGAFRIPSSPETAVMIDQGDGNYRALDHMHMDGNEVFNFVQTAVPPMLNSALDREGKRIDDFDWFLFHQPNRFMLQKLAEKVGIPLDRMPMNLVENYGNPSGASIPMTAILNCRDELISKNNRCCLSAFGSGLAWGVMFLEIGNLEYCEMIESPF